MTAFDFCCKLNMKLPSWLEFISSIFFVLIFGHDSISEVWSDGNTCPEAAEFSRITFSELLKNNGKKNSPDWSEVSRCWKQIDRCSRWIQSQLIREIPWDRWALLNAGHPLPLNPSQIPNTAATSQTSRSEQGETLQDFLRHARGKHRKSQHQLSKSNFSASWKNLVLPKLTLSGRD